ncbi:MAG TPA: ISKra4 family transposase, partial [Urbifossiella sp.]|nr:ISKra4 family transposase [Urbifossiella sp.]
LNRRLKQTGARWKVEHVGPLVELGALAAGPEWATLW